MVTSVILTLIAFSPAAMFWFETVSGLSQELADFALGPLRILTLIPALSVFLSLERGFLVHVRRTSPIIIATMIEIIGIVAVLLLTITVLEIPGAVAAAVAFMAGRLGHNLYLLPPSVRASRKATENQ